MSFKPFLKGWPLAAWGLLGLGGCGPDWDGPPLAHVSGIVTLDGAPLPNAIIIFEPIGEGHPATGFTDENGEYDLEYNEGIPGAVVGPALVRISTWRAGYDNGTFHPSIPEKVPVLYNARSQENPQMKRQVEPNDNEIDFDLSSTAGEIERHPELPVPVLGQR
ncbi:MAG: carboxypeptidase regulatory-like domain-containing protein [Planctomycetes bacterium]|nr:carboxypeptidase regulatory-like domain-containing protein [Planctomycetota bacterium]